VPGKLDCKAIAILASDGLERAVLERSRRTIEREGGLAVVVARAGDPPRARDGDPVGVDAALGSVVPSDFDALVLPATSARARSEAAKSLARWFVRGFVSAGKPVAVILADGAGAGDDRRDGAVVDGALVICRGAHELASALDAFIERIMHARRGGAARG
jgi:hypothetical protein